MVSPGAILVSPRTTVFDNYIYIPTDLFDDRQILIENLREKTADKTSEKFLKIQYYLSLKRKPEMKTVKNKQTNNGGKKQKKKHSTLSTYSIEIPKEILSRIFVES